jgi:hypothetical protein
MVPRSSPFVSECSIDKFFNILCGGMNPEEAPPMDCFSGDIQYFYFLF